MHCVLILFFFHQQVIPKSEILRLGVLEQSKEEVIVQVGFENRHPNSPVISMPELPETVFMQ